MEDKKRAPNFSNREKVLLLNLVSDYKDVIENKKTNSQTWRQKDDAWQKMTNLFNSQTPENYQRSKDSLRKYYDNIKKSLRKDIAEEKKEVQKTGGGGYQVFVDPINELALGIVNPKTVFGLSNPYDTDLTAEEEITLSQDSEHMEHTYSAKASHTPDPFTSGALSTAVTVSTMAAHKKQKSDENVPLRELASSKNKGKRNFVHVETKQSDALKPMWTKRRRPAVQQLTSSQLSEEYLQLAKIKQECYEAERAGILKRNQHNEEIFELQKKKLLLEILNLERNL